LNRKLLILDLALAGTLVWAGFQFRDQWRAGKAREAAQLNQKIKPAPPPAFTPLPGAPAVLASSYAEIAQKMLFDRSRNPTVVIEVPPPPPPKPMPPLPLYHGSMNIGDGPMAIMSMASGPYQEVRVGAAIGEFKLLEVNAREIALEWDGKVVRKRVDEMQDRAAAEAPVQRTQAPASAPPAETAKVPMGPGFDMGRGMRACNPNDSNPPGTVAEGYRKVVTTTPFGQSCRWEQMTK
jgi:hypothetical protein